MKRILCLTTGLLLLLHVLAVFAQSEIEQLAASGENTTPDNVLVAPAAALQPLSVPPFQGQDTSPGDGVFIDPVPSLLAPAIFRMTERRADRIGLQWHDRTDLEDSVQVLRSEGQVLGDPIETFGPQTGFNNFVDTTVMPDTRYCYRIRVTKGEDWKVSKPLCIFTPSALDLLLFRAQIEIKVANRENADTNDPVAVRLNSPGGIGFRPSTNETWLNHGHDDFERGSIFTYDLLIPAKLSDITVLSLVKEGTDGVCIESLKLILNATEDHPGYTVFNRNFSTETAGCHWVDEGDGREPILSFSHSELRLASQWPTSESQWCGNRQNCAASIFPINLSTLEHQLEGAIGHFLHFNDQADWPPQPVEGLPPPRRVALSVIDYRTARIRIQLRGDAPILPDPNVVITGDIVIVPHETSAGAKLSLELDHVHANVDFNILADALGVAGGILIGSESCINLMDCLEGFIEGTIEGTFPPISEEFELPAVLDVFCPVLELRDPPAEGVDAVIEVVNPLPLCTDFDSDGMPNAWENENGFDRYDFSDKIDDPDGDGALNLERFNCVSCELREGDCDSDAECGENMVCVDDIGPRFGYPEKWDVCVCAPGVLCNTPSEATTIGVSVP